MGHHIAAVLQIHAASKLPRIISCLQLTATAVVAAAVVEQLQTGPKKLVCGILIPSINGEVDQCWYCRAAVVGFHQCAAVTLINSVSSNADHADLA